MGHDQLRFWITTALELAGATMVSVGVFLIYPPLALILAGVAMFALSWRLSR